MSIDYVVYTSQRRGFSILSQGGYRNGIFVVTGSGNACATIGK